MAIRLTARSVLQRAQPLGHARAREPVTAAARRHLDRDQIAVARVGAGAGGNRKLAAELLLVDRLDPSAAARGRAENAEHALLAAIDELDDAAGVMERLVLLAAVLDPQQDAVADAGNLVRPRAAWNPDADLGGGAVLGLIPFGRDRDQFAVAVARRDVGDHDMGQGPGMVQLLAALLDAALVRKLAQHRLEGGAVGVPQVEGARDLAGADFSGLLADEGDDVVFGGKRGFAVRAFHGSDRSR